MTRHLAKALDAIWYLSMGLFLGLTGGLVLSVIITFRGAREIDASPGIVPYSDPMFAEYHNEAVAGYIGQELFMVGGRIACWLIGIAILTRFASHFVLGRPRRAPWRSATRWFYEFRNLGLFICAVFISMAADTTIDMNNAWPSLYETQADQIQLEQRRADFQVMHQDSESLVGTAWVCGLIALGISPWCRHVANDSLKPNNEVEK